MMPQHAKDCVVHMLIKNLLSVAVRIGNHGQEGRILFQLFLFFVVA